MPHLVIRQFPDPVLRRISEPVHGLKKPVRRFIERLIETMVAQPGGIGIAAPQVGVLKRVAIVDVSSRVPGAKQLILINPVILKAEELRVSREGCMSLPHYTANVNRANQIYIRWKDLDLRTHEMWAAGIEAICIQHEIDHLNGLLFLDRVGSLRTDVFRRKRYL